MTARFVKNYTANFQLDFSLLQKKERVRFLSTMTRLDFRCAVRSIGVFRLKQLSTDSATLIFPFISHVPFFFLSFFLFFFLFFPAPGRFSLFPFNWPLSFPLSVVSFACLPPFLPFPSTGFVSLCSLFRSPLIPPIHRRCPQIRIPHRRWNNSGKLSTSVSAIDDFLISEIEQTLPSGGFFFKFPVGFLSPSIMFQLIYLLSRDCVRPVFQLRFNRLFLYSFLLSFSLADKKLRSESSFYLDLLFAISP